MADGAKRRPRKARKLPDEGMPAMNRRELILTVAGDAGVTDADAEWMVAVVLDAMARPLTRGRSLRITGFGSFKVRKQAPRYARNPQTGGKVLVDGQNVPAWTPAQRMRDLLNGKLRLKKGDRIVTKVPKGTYGHAG